MARLTRLELVEFRSYARAEVAFDTGPSVLVGPNAQGKTNLLEAVHYLAIGGSHRVASDGPLVRSGAGAAVVRAQIRADDGRAQRIELEVRPGGRNRVRVDGQALTRTRDGLGVLRAVLFAPEDLTLVRGEPADRRRFLDELLAQRRPSYLAARQEYEKVLRQRNALLKDHRRHGGPPPATLDAWTDALARGGATLLAARVAVVHALAAPTQDAYSSLLAGGGQVAAASGVSLSYELSTGRAVEGRSGAGMPDPRELADELRDGLVERAAEERERGTTVAGPHRDDLMLSIGALPAKGFASHGESWSLALALRLASREVLREVGDEPVVLLDDVFAELDARRRAQLAARCGDFEQVLVTAAVDEDVPVPGPRYQVRLGAVDGPVTELGHSARPTDVTSNAGSATERDVS